MEVPTYQEKVGIETGGTPSPQLPGITEAASGANIGEAGARVGTAIEHVAGDFAHAMAYKAHLDAQEKSNEKLFQLNQEYEQHAKAEGGWLTKQGNQAEGITHGTDPKKVDDNSFDGWFDKRKSELLNGSGGLEQMYLTRKLDQHGAMWRNAVIDHETAQRKVARDNAANASIDASANTFALNPSKNAAIFDTAKGDLATHLSGAADVTLADKTRMMADHFAEKAVNANIEQDPQKAQDALSILKDRMSADKYGILSAAVNKKSEQDRAANYWGAINGQNDVRDASLHYDLGSVDKHAQEMAEKDGLPAKDQMAIRKTLRELAVTQNSNLDQEKKLSTRGALDMMAKIKQSNPDILAPDAMKQVLTKYGGSFGADEQEDLRKSLLGVYAKSADGTQARLKAMTPEQQAVYSEISTALKAKYKGQTATLPGEDTPVNLADVALKRFSEAAPGMHPADMHKWFDENTKNVPTTPAWSLMHKIGLEWGTHPAPQMFERQHLESTYGRKSVAEALQALSKDKKPFGYAEIESYLKNKK